MHILKLIKPVIIEGADYFGRKSKLIFSPTSAHKPGFYWKYSPIEPAILITSDLISAKKRRISLKAPNDRILNIYEHIGVLRYVGFDGIEISCFSQWPPYFNIADVCEKLIRNSTITNEKIRWCTVDKTYSFSTANSKRITTLSPLQQGERPALKVIVTCSYENLGQKTEHYKVPGSFLRALYAHPQGWPSWSFHFAKIASKFGWPHLNHITWPQVYGKRTLKLFDDHRLADILGCFSLLDPTGLFAGTILSHCSGHSLDVKVLMQARNGIVRLN